MIDSKKASIVLILNVLKEYTDDNHYLTQQEIIDKVEQLYGLSLERKSISSSLSLLEELGFDINKAPKGGYALLSREFDDSEIKFIIDAIFSSKSISGRQAKNLCNKVSSCLSRYDRKTYDYLLKSEEINRTDNKQVFCNIEIINDAIKRNKWVGFKCLTYDNNGKLIARYNGYEYHASPCYLVNSFGRYYLLAYRRKYDSVNTYRLDNIIDMYIIEDRERLDPKSLEEFKGYKNINEYINEHIYMFGGNSITATVKLNEPSSITYLKDWFGKNADIYKKEDGLYADIKCNEMAFFYWIMQYGEHMTLISPQSMIDLIKKAATQILEKYK